MCTPTWMVPALAVGLCLFLAVATAHAREPLDLVPADSLLCWYGRPLPDAAPSSDQPSTLQTLLEVGARIAGGSFDSGTQLDVRMAEMLGLTIRYPYAVALIDARATPTAADPTARRVDRLRFALVVENGDQTEPFLRIIQKAVNEQTHSGEATLTTEKAGRWTYQELHDQRLPDWSAIAWGHMDGYFVLTVGANVWPSVAAVAEGDEPSLSRDAWYAVARAKQRRTALIEIFVGAKAIQERLDPFVDGRAGEFFRAWEAGSMEQAHWVLGYEGRALYCIAHFRKGDETIRRVYADPENRDPRLREAIPPEARYAIFDIPAGRFLTRFCRGLLVFQGAEARANIEQQWAEVESQCGFDTERDFLAHLGGRIVLHNDPPHPLHLPLALTTLIEIRDEPATVRRTVERICEAWRARLDEVAARGARRRRSHCTGTMTACGICASG